MSSVFEFGGTAVNKNTAIAMSGGTNYDRKRNHSQEHFKNKPRLPDFPENTPVYTLTYQDWYTDVYYVGATSETLVFRIEVVHRVEPKINELHYVEGTFLQAVNRAIQIHHEEH